MNFFKKNKYKTLDKSLSDSKIQLDSLLCDIKVKNDDLLTLNNNITKLNNDIKLKQEELKQYTDIIDLRTEHKYFKIYIDDIVKYIQYSFLDKLGPFFKQLKDENKSEIRLYNFDFDLLENLLYCIEYNLTLYYTNKEKRMLEKYMLENTVKISPKFEQYIKIHGDIINTNKIVKIVNKSDECYILYILEDNIKAYQCFTSLDNTEKYYENICNKLNLK